MSGKKPFFDFLGVNKKITKSGSGASGSSSASNTNDQTQNAAANSVVASAVASSGPGETPTHYFEKELTESDMGYRFVLAKSGVEEHIVRNLNEIDKAKLKAEVPINISVVDYGTRKCHPMNLIMKGRQYHLTRTSALVRDNKLEIKQKIKFVWHENILYVYC